MVADVNGDGIPDLIVLGAGTGPGGGGFGDGGYEAGQIAVMLGNGNGTFQAPIEYQPLMYPGWAAVGDFNGDGLPDIAVTQSVNGNAVDVLLNQPTGPQLVAPATATPSVIYTNSAPGTTTALSVLASDAAYGASSLTYTWSSSGPAAVAFSANGSNAAQNATVTFSQDGFYTFTVTITDPGGASITNSVAVQVVANQAPTVAVAASAAPSPVSGTTAVLSALGSSIEGYEDLSYTWTATSVPAGAPTPTFGATTFSAINGNNVTSGGQAVADTTVTFYQAGSYTFQVTMTDLTGLSVTSRVNVTVQQALTSIAVTPLSASVLDGRTQQFSATALDQFGKPLATQPALTWSVSGLGSIDQSSGLYSAPASGTGSAAVTARSGSIISNSASVTVVAGQSASSPTVTGISPSAGLTSGGTAVTITGTNFTGASAVKFGSVAATSFSVVSANQITATAPAEAAGTVDITVTTPAGTSATSAADKYTFATTLPVQVDLSSAFNHVGIVTDGAPFSTSSGWGGVTKYALSSSLLGPQVNWNGTAFNLGAANVADAISTSGQTINLPAGNFATLNLLAFAVNGGPQPSQTFTITYTDGTTQTITQSISNWFTPQNYVGEATAATLAYTDASNGNRFNTKMYVYGYSFALNSGKTVKSITLPNNADVAVLAMTLE